jgi:hypothetical protein
MTVMGLKFPRTSFVAPFFVIDPPCEVAMAPIPPSFKYQIGKYKNMTHAERVR